MARNFIAASSQYMELVAVPVTALPVTLACWFRPLTATATYNLVVVGDNTAGTSYFALIASNTGALGKVSAEQADPGISRSAATTTTFAAGSWHHACAAFASTTSRSAYLDGAGKATEATAITSTTGLVATTVGAYHVGASAFSPMSGLIAEVAIWNVDLSDAEVAALAGRTGDSLWQLPLRIRPANLVAYWPLLGENSPEFNWSGDGTARNLSAVAGPVVVPHPDFLLPPRRRGVAYAPAAVPAFVAPVPLVVGQAVQRAAYW